MTSFKHWVVPEVIKTYQSKFNAKVEIVKFMGVLRLDMGDLTQSGQIIEDIWGGALRKLLKRDFLPQSILILGLGAGSAARVVSRRWPKSKIIGVEIDPVVIDIAREHFYLEKIKNLEVVNQDATEFVSHLGDDKHFSLTLVDCYLGYKIPPSLENTEFLLNLKSKTDKLLLNRLFWDEYKTKTLTFMNTVSPHFAIRNHRTPSNLVLSLDEHNSPELGSK